MHLILFSQLLAQQNKIMQSTSSKNLRVRSSSHNNNQKSPNRPISPQKKFDHKKQIQATLNQLHQLQAQIYSLNVPQNPHSSGPIKKEIKQLSYLYESMTKPKVKNRLNIEMKDIKSALQIMNDGIKALDERKSPFKNQEGRKSESPQKSQQISLLKQFKPVIQSQPQPQSRTKIASKTLKQIMKQLYGTDFDLSLVSDSKSTRVMQITAEQIEKFINYSEFDSFEPLRQAYECLLDDQGKFSFKKYNEINQMLGLPKIKELEILKQSIGVENGENITFEKFMQVIQEGAEMYE